MQHESDGIHEVLQGQGRVLIAVAGHVGEALARAREQQLRETAAADTESARVMQQRLDAERAAARASVAPVAQAGWADHASPEQVVEAWQTTTQWSGSDPAIDDARRSLHDWGKERGVDLEALNADVEAVRAALADRAKGMHEAARAPGEDHEGSAYLELAAIELEDALDAYADGRPADGEDLEAVSHEHDDMGEALYDSADRRRDLAATLVGRGIETEAVNARVLADTSAAAPIAEAAASGTKSRGPAKAAAAKRTRSKATDRSRGR